MFARDQNSKVKPFIEGIRISDYYQRQLLPSAFRISGVVDIFSVLANGPIIDGRNHLSNMIRDELRGIIGKENLEK